MQTKHKNKAPINMSANRTSNNINTTEKLVVENFMNLDIADTATDRVDQSSDQNYYDVEDLLKVNRIIKNGSKTYLDLDTNVINNLVTDNFINFDITGTNADRIGQSQEIMADFQPVFDLDDFYKTFIEDQCSEADLTETTNTGNATIVEESTNISCKQENVLSESLKLENTEESKQEFEKILQCYFENESGKNVDLMNEGIVSESSQFGNTYNVIEVPIDLDQNVKYTSQPATEKQGTETNKLRTLTVEYDSELSESEVSSKNASIGGCYFTSCAHCNKAPAKPVLLSKIKENAQNISSSDNNKNIDIYESISIQDSDSECEGYHSSDFEFITESEAKRAGLISNNKQKSSKMKQKERTENNVEHHEYSKINNAPGPSKIAEHRQSTDDKSKYWSKSYNRRLMVDQYYKDLKNNRENHEILQGDAYFEMFRGIHASMSMFLENKSVKSAACMTIQDFDYEGMTLMGNREESVDKQLQEEAKENAKRILEKYPGHNRRKRRRF